MNVVERATDVIDDIINSNDSLTQAILESEALKLLPELVAECKSLRANKDSAEACIEDQKTQNNDLMAHCNQLRARAQKAESKAARWQMAAQLATAQRSLLTGQNDDLMWWDCIADDVKIDLMKRAAASLGSKPRAWAMTEERIKALEYAALLVDLEAARLIVDPDADYEPNKAARKDLRAMLAEASQ